MKPEKKITSWSFSRWAEYQDCPKKAYFKCILKLKEPGSAAMDRGTAIHKLAEDYVNAAIKKLPAELSQFKDEFAALKSQPIKYVEESWTFKSNWDQTSWNDWTGAWLRVKLDVAYHNVEHNALVVIDHKTGKFSDYKLGPYMDQLELYGLAGLKRFPTVDVVSPRLWFLDHGITHPDPQKEELEYFRKDEKLLEKKWLAKVKPMLNDTTFKEKPGNACRFCHFKKENGGPCLF